jgi:putative addiction module component (TIGR02574 family)
MCVETTSRKARWHDYGPPVSTHLPAAERKKLIAKFKRLLADVPDTVDPIEAAWRKETLRRIAEVRSGKAKMIPWEEVKLSMQEKLSK